MKKKLVVALAVVIALSLVLAGCKATLDVDGLELLATAITESQKATSYKVSYYKSGEGDTGTTKMLMVSPGKDGEVGYSTKQIKFSIKESRTGKDVWQDFVYSYSLPSTIKPKKAKAEDYQYFLFTLNEKEKQVVDGKEVAKREKTAITSADEAYNDAGAKPFFIENVFANLSSLTNETVSFEGSQFGVKKDGKTTFVRFKVTDTNNPYSQFSSVEVHILYGKIVKIGTYSEEYKNALGQMVVAADGEKTEIVYKSPKLETINYDHKDYNR